MTDPLDLSQFPGLSKSETGLALPSRIADLAASFPLLFFMLASDSGSFARRLEVVRLATEGKPLADLAAAYGLPLCFRRVPAQACVTLLPWVGWSGRVAPALANHMPQKLPELTNWLPAVFHAALLGDEDFALWVARQRALFARPLDARLLQPVAMFAWYSNRPDDPLACITVKRWSPAFGLTRAIEETEAWLKRLLILAQCGSYPIEDTWFLGGRVGTFEFVPIVTLEGLASERLAMRNCLHTYVDRLAASSCRLFAVKCGERSVATLEIAKGGPGGFSIIQLKGPGNVGPSREVQAAAEIWLNGQKNLDPPAIRRLRTRTQPLDLGQLLASYRQAPSRGRAPNLTSMSLLVETMSQLRSHLDPQRAPPRLRPPRFPLAHRPVLEAAPPPRSPELNRAHAMLRARVGEDVYGAWFRPLEFESYTGGVVRLSVPVRFLRNWIQTHYLHILQDCFIHGWPDMVRVEVVVRTPVPQPMRPEGAFLAIQEGPTPIGIADILNAVARHFGITRADLVSERRHRCVVVPRQIGMYLARQLCPVGAAQIGRRFGNRDTSTVIHAVRRIEERLLVDAAFRDEVERVRRALVEPER